MRAEQPTKLCKPRRKIRVKVGFSLSPKFRNHRQRIISLLDSINGRDYCLTDKINSNQLLILIKFKSPSAVNHFTGKFF